MLNTLLNLKLAGSIAAAEPGPGEYRALVCIFLNGGWDSFNILVPRGAAEYGEYAAVRQDLARGRGRRTPQGLASVIGAAADRRDHRQEDGHRIR